MSQDLHNPALGFALALAIGMVAQVLARHLRLPGIVLLLAAGVLAGPDALNIVRPDDLSGAVAVIVSIAVAIILFEGGMNLDLRRLRAEALVIRRLVTLGAGITAVGATVATRLLMGWDWRLSTLFGTLCIVTGPTVVTPLIRRLRVKQPVSTILEAEGVLIDPIGAIIAVVALEFLYADTGAATLALPAVVLGGGALIGAAAGGLIALLLRRPGIVPEGLENVFVLALVVALFQLSELLIRESGLAAVVAAGLVVGNAHVRATQGLLEFKEQLTTLLIGLLFVLLAADVRIAEVRALGWPAPATAAALMLVIRPVQALLCSAGTSLTLPQRAFLASLAPRGIVAAAVASLFAETIAERGEAGGPELRALMFLVIAITVTVHGLSGGLIARLLHMRRPSDNGWAILGVNELSLALARLLREEQPDIVFVDSNPDRVQAARDANFTAVQGQGLLPEVLARVDPDSRLGCIAFTPNEEVNLLWARRVRAETRAPRVYVALGDSPRSLPTDEVHEAGAALLFAAGRPLDHWAKSLENGSAVIERWRHVRSSGAGAPADSGPDPGRILLLLTSRRAGRIRPVDERTVWRDRDEADVAILEGQRAVAEARLRASGWSSTDAPTAMPDVP